MNKEGLALDKKNIGLIAVMVLFTIILFYPSLSYEFLHSLDDDWLLTNNAYIKDFSLRGVFNLFYFDKTDFHYHPLTYLSYMIDYKLFGLNPMGYKIHNLILHIGCGVLMYIFIYSLTKNRFLSFFTAFIFLIHPVNMDSVIWASCRRQSLSLFYFLLSNILYFYSCNSKKIKWKLFFISFIIASLSIMVKASNMIIPFVFFLIFYTVRKKFSKEIFIQILLFVPVLIFFTILNENANNRNFLQRTFDYSLLEHFIFMGYSYFFYWFKAIVPFPLGVFYPAPSETLSVLPIEYYLFFLFSLFIVGVMIYHFMRQQWIHFFALMYYTLNICLLLNLMFFPLGDLPMLVSNRYFYHSSLGLILYIGLLLYQLLKNNKMLRVIFTSLIVLYLSVSFRIQMPIWKNGKELLKNTIKYFPSEEMCYRLAIDYYDEGDKASAYKYMDRGDNLGTNIWINNNWYFFYLKAKIYFNKGDFSRSLSSINTMFEKDPPPLLSRQMYDDFNNLDVPKDIPDEEYKEILKILKNLQKK